MTAAIDPADYGALLEMEGTVAEQPTVRYMPVGTSGDSLPVLCLKVNEVGPHRTLSFTCNQPFPANKYAAAQARAKQLKPGMRIKVQVVPQLVECHFPVTAHIHAVSATESQEANHAHV